MCWVLANDFPQLSRWSYDLFLLYFVNMVITFLKNVRTVLRFYHKSNWYAIILVFCWTQFSDILFENLSVFRREIGVSSWIVPPFSFLIFTICAFFPPLISLAWGLSNLLFYQWTYFDFFFAIVCLFSNLLISVHSLFFPNIFGFRFSVFSNFVKMLLRLLIFSFSNICIQSSAFSSSMALIVSS